MLNFHLFSAIIITLLTIKHFLLSTTHYRAAADAKYLEGHSKWNLQSSMHFSTRIVSFMWESAHEPIFGLQVPKLLYLIMCRLAHRASGLFD